MSSFRVFKCAMVALVVALAFAEAVPGHGRRRKMLVASGEWQSPSGAPWTGFTATTTNFNLEAQNDTKTFLAHPTTNTADWDCLISGADASNPSTYYPGPLTVDVPLGYSSAIQFIQPPTARYQYIGSTGPDLQVNVDSNGQVPINAVYHPSSSDTSTPSTLSFGVFAGSDATARCQVSITFVAGQAIPSSIPQPVITPGSVPGSYGR